MAYLLDSNVFIAAKRQHYGFDFCPAFWDWIVAANESGTVFSVDRVEDEVLAAGDELSEWARAQSVGFFLSPDPSVLPSMSVVTSWANAQNYEPEAVNAFMRVADFYLVAQAHSGGHIVVTHEVPSGSIRKIKIPNACIGLGIKCMTPFQMLRRERARFVLGAAS